MKTAIVYESWHHGNTKKLCEAIQKEYDVTLLNIKADDIALEEYALIGIASGVAYGKFYQEIEQVIKEKMPAGKNVFFDVHLRETGSGLCQKHQAHACLEKLQYSRLLWLQGL